VATSWRRAAPVWLATISPSIASALGRTPVRLASERVSKMLGVTRKTPISFGSSFELSVSSRQTSSAIDAPAPPAIEDTIRTIGVLSS
jgi:hypothetical protein